MTQKQIEDGIEKIVKKVNAHEGAMLGLSLVVASLLKVNPGITFDEKAVGKLILESAKDPDIQKRAREIMHEITAFSGRLSMLQAR